MPAAISPTRSEKYFGIGWSFVGYITDIYIWKRNATAKQPKRKDPDEYK